MAISEKRGSISTETPAKTLDSFFNTHFQTIRAPISNVQLLLTPLSRKPVETYVEEDVLNYIQGREYKLRHVDRYIALLNQGRITGQNYEADCLTINSLSRQLLGFTHFIVALSDFERRALADKEDVVGKRASPQLESVILRDGLYDENEYNSEREGGIPDLVYDQWNGWEEGTNFSPAFDYEDNLTSMRLYHRSHRNTLQVGTVKSGELFTAMRERIHEASQPLPSIVKPDLETASRKTFERDLQRINKELIRHKIGIQLAIGTKKSGGSVIYGTITCSLGEFASKVNEKTNLHVEQGLHTPYIRDDQHYINLVPVNRVLSESGKREAERYGFLVDNIDSTATVRHVLSKLIE